MIRALLYGDLQATEGHERCFLNPAMPLQRYRVGLLYKKLLEIYHERGCNAIWDAGDTTDDRTAIPMPVLSLIANGIRPFAGSSWNIKATGNHEQYTRNTDIDNRHMFDQVFKVVDGIQAFEIEGVVVIAVSFPASQSACAEQLESLMLRYRNKPIIVFGHLEISGTKMKSGVSITGMPRELFDPAQMVLLGHIHLPQQLGDNIFYIGSPFQQDYGEAGETKRVGIVTIEGDSIQLEWVPLDGFPQYRRVSWNEFTECFDSQSEDRFTVTLTSPDEAAAFYKHPYSSRAIAEYSYNVLNPELPTQETAAKDWTLHAAVRRWVERKDPAKLNITSTPDDLLAFGLQIAEGELLR